MKIISNTTSPFARIARIALAEKGFDLSDTTMLNPWDDPPELLALNTAARVPTLETEDGVPLTESLLIVLWLENKYPSPSLLDGPTDRIMSQAGRAFGVIDAMTQIIIGVMHVDPGWAESEVGLRRRRTIVTGMRALDDEPPTWDGALPHIGVLVTVVALDYMRLRFGGESWVEALPNLDALRARVAERAAYANTEPYT